MTYEIKAARAGVQDLSEDERRWIEALQSKKQHPVIHIKRRRSSRSPTQSGSTLHDRDRAPGAGSTKQARIFNVPAATDRKVEDSPDPTRNTGSEGARLPSSTPSELKKFRRRRDPSQLPGPVNWIVSEPAGAEPFDVMAIDAVHGGAPGVESSEYRITVMALEKLRKTLEEVRAVQCFAL